MNTVRSLTLGGFASLLLSTSGPGQAPSPTSYVGPVRHHHLDHATGVITPLGETAADGGERREGGQPQVPSVWTFSNNVLSGQYAGPPNREEWVDFGVKSGGQTGLVTTFRFAYGTLQLDPQVGGQGAAIGVNFYAGTQGRCSGMQSAATNPGVQVGTFVFAGLPGTNSLGSPAAHTVTVDISRDAICIPDGEIGWSYVDVGNGGLTGPLLVIPETLGGGINTGTQDGFDLYRPAPASPASCVAFTGFAAPGGGSAGIASFYIRLMEDDGSISPRADMRNGSGVNPVTYTTSNLPFVGSNWSARIQTNPATTATFILFSTVSDTGTPFSIGELLIVPTNSVDQALGTHVIPVPKDTALIGGKAFTQGLRVDNGSCVLLNAIDLTVGT